MPKLRAVQQPAQLRRSDQHQPPRGYRARTSLPVAGRRGPKSVLSRNFSPRHSTIGTVRAALASF